MNKMDALNQIFVCRVCKALNDYNIGLYDQNGIVKVINNIRNDYLEGMNDILEETIINE